MELLLLYLECGLENNWKTLEVDDMLMKEKFPFGQNFTEKKGKKRPSLLQVSAS